MNPTHPPWKGRVDVQSNVSQERERESGSGHLAELTSKHQHRKGVGRPEGAWPEVESSSKNTRHW